MIPKVIRKKFFSKKILFKAFRDTIPVMTGYLVLSMGFGILLKTKGYGGWWALGMSLFIYAGSMQYLTIDLLSGGASLVAAALTALLVNARHLFYGISMVDQYKDTGKKKPYLIFALTALFVTIFVEQWLTAGEHRQAILGVGVSAVCLLVFGPEGFLIPSMLGIWEERFCI